MSKPKIRFKGFIEDWEQRKLDDVAKFTKGTGYSKGDLVDSGTPIILYGRLYTNYETTIRDVDTFVVEKENSVFSRGGEVIVPASGETAEDIARASAVENAGVLLGGDLNIIETGENINSSFLALTISNGNSQKELAKKAQGKSVVHIRNDEIKRVLISLPTKVEQDKIAIYFDKLDTLITLHQRKCDETKKLKKYMLQKMFPQNGKNIPEIRFDGFTEDWEQRKLGEVCQITMGQSPDGSTYSEEPSDYILVQGNADLKEGWVEPRVWTTQKTKMAQAGDLIMSVRAPAGAMGKTAYDVVLGRGVAGIKGNEFLYQSLVKMDADGYWKKMAAGSTFESINSDVVKNAEIFLPQDIEEQKKIGLYFMSLDTLLTLHQQKYEELQKIKKFMLQNMFI